ncbi:IQ and ubiquitin-like domain-containing protein [Orbicella faveolata]|uniref:IQ and ubiquitin-like domain-containing protein n=1 Tax=Orbicella faveolata TaxID=48498 RepID=UPI0009E24B2E|nr:IQ and ubiquitin-like domain-containing protein [Orbicella faveolata]
MSAEGEGVENKVANDGNSEEQQTKEDSPQVGIAVDPTQPVDQNGGDIDHDSAQVVTVTEKEDVAEKDDEEKKEKNEVVDASIDPKNSITTEEISENPPEEQQSPASQKEDPKMDEPAMSVVISEPDKDVVTQEANAQTEGRESPIGNAGVSVDSPGKGDNRVIETQSESDSPLVAPPTSKAEKSIDNEIPAKNVTGHPESGGIAKDGFTANVKFIIMPEGHVQSMTCSLKQSFSELRNHFSSEFNQPPQVILMIFDGKMVEDHTVLSDLGVQSGQTVQVEIQSADPVNRPLHYRQASPAYKLPDKVNVKVEVGGKEVEVVVYIVQETRKKPFLGGYKHRLTGVEFHNASVQTLPKVRVPSSVEKFHRDTQTYKLRNRVQQTTNTTSTQMTKDGCYVSNVQDKILIPGKYVTAEQQHRKILKKVIILQTYWRRWLAKNYVQRLREDRKRRQEWERQEELRKQRERAERIKREWERRINPKTKEDFDLLYAHLEKWRNEEMAIIDELYAGPERKAALVGLLEQEAYLIASIDRHKLSADEENRDKRVKNFLNKAAAPKQWKAFDGKITEMDTPYTIRAQELRDIYSTLSMKYLTQDERLDVLLTLKHTVKEHDCKLTQEIIELIDREADLLMRGVKESNLEGLRKRILTLFLQYCKTPLFNPEAARLIKVPQDPTVLRKNIYFCPSCNAYLPSTEFQLSSNSRVVGRCRKCTKLDNDARLRHDFSQYRVMLKDLRRSEESFEDGSKVAYLLQEPDLRYLVENIWNSQSVLSAHEDLFDLVLVRWNKYEEWSPWNCILLTKEEASAHAKLENVTEAYGRMFIGKILHKHVLARNYFSRLPGMAEHMKKISVQSQGLANNGLRAASLKA